MDNDILAMDSDAWDDLPIIQPDLWQRGRTRLTVSEAHQEFQTLIHDLPEYIKDQSNAESIYQDCTDIQDSEDKKLVDPLAELLADYNTTLNPSVVSLSMDLQKSDLESHHSIITSSAHHKIYTNTYKKHIMFPKYPTTSQDSVIHIIYLKKNPLRNNTAPIDVCSALMSNVSKIYI